MLESSDIDGKAQTYARHRGEESGTAVGHKQKRDPRDRHDTHRHTNVDDKMEEVDRTDTRRKVYAKGVGGRFENLRQPKEDEQEENKHEYTAQ